MSEKHVLFSVIQLITDKSVKVVKVKISTFLYVRAREGVKSEVINIHLSNDNSDTTGETISPKTLRHLQSLRSILLSNASMCYTSFEKSR